MRVTDAALAPDGFEARAPAHHHAHRVKEPGPVLENQEMVINYGLDKLRFLQPVKPGQRVRVHTKIVAVRRKRPGQYLIKSEKTMEIEGEEKPAFVAQMLVLLVGEGR